MQNLILTFMSETKNKTATDALKTIGLITITTILLTGCGGASPIDLNPPSNSSGPDEITDNEDTDIPDDLGDSQDGISDTDPDPVVLNYQVTGTYCSCGPTSESSSSINRETENLDHLDGVLVRISWADMNPHLGVYDWSYLDEQISYAEDRGIKISFAALNGSKAPDWLEEEGAELFEYTLRGNTVHLPLPWDATYLSYYQDFIAELGNRYRDSPAIELVHVTNSTTNGFEMQYTFNSTQISEFEAAGYTENALISSWTTIIDAYATAFPNKPIDVEVHPVFSSDNIANAVFDHGIQNYGKRFGILAAWWSEHNAKNVYTGMYAIMQQAKIESFAGVQLVGAVSAGLNPLSEEELEAALQLAIDNGFLYMEIWNDDLANSELRDLIIANDELIEVHTEDQ